MFYKSSIIVFSLYCFFIENVLGQVCVETKMSWRDVPETFLYTYMEAYERSDCLFWCTDTRVATAVGTRNVRKQVAEQINVCCDGYVEEALNPDDMPRFNSFHCKPVCSPQCQNGYCKTPGVCACSHGYLPSMYESNTCVPLCIKGCEHGICKAPNTCECEEGYENVDEICEPICFDPCDNGTCIAPDTCQCLPGYKKSDNDICEPFCSSYTATGECINTTTCEPGWEKVTTGAIETCQPVCTEPCVNSTCVAPDICECSDGYEKSVLGTCEPICSSGCPQGKCIGPETCVCDPGWFIKESNGPCLAHCDHACGNGTCVAPNVCECFPGYVIDEAKLLQEHGGPLCVPVCENCEEPCIDLESCMCPWPQLPMRVTSAGEHCFDSADKCDRTICIMTTTTITTPDDTSTEANTITTEVVLTTVETEAIETTTQINISDYYELKIDKASWFHSKWFIGIGSVLLILIVVILVAAVLKRKYSNSFQSNEFGSGGDDVSAVVHYKQSSMS